jgi:hypothetical protein
MTDQVCDYCGEPVEGEPVRRGSRVYCSEACAFEASRSKDCGGRTDSPISPRVVEPTDQ